MSHAKNRMLRLQQVKILLLESGGMHYKLLVEKLGVDKATIFRDLEELGAESDENSVWRYTPTSEDMKLASLLYNEDVRFTNSFKTIWNGIEFESMAAAARDVGITTEAMRQRIEKGYICDDDMLRGYSERPIIWNDVEYPSITAAAKAIGVSNSSMWRRVQSGYTRDEDMKRKRN